MPAPRGTPCKRGGRIPPARVGSEAASCIDLAPLVTRRFSPDEIEEAYRLFSNQEEGVPKVAITP